MPAGTIRIVGALVVLLGLTMLFSAGISAFLSDAVFNIFRVLHLILAIAFVGLFEMAMSRRKGTITVAGRQLGLTGRIILTVTLLLGLYLLLSHVVDAFIGYGGLIWVHGLLGIISFGLVEMALSRRRSASS